MKRAGLFIIALALLVSDFALANPRAAPFVRLYGESNGRHVLLTNTGNRTARVVAFHGTTRTDWEDNGHRRTEDMGSGIQESWFEESMCDCHVPTGTRLNYQVEGYQVVYVDTPATPNDLIVCDQACARADERAGVSQDSGAGRQDTVTTTQTNTAKDAGTDPSATGRGACTVGTRFSGDALPILLALGLAVCGLRRRR